MRTPTWRVVLVLAAVLGGLVFTLPNFFSQATLDRLPDWLPKQQITLGLDLQGGSHLLLEVDTAALIEDRLETIVGDVRLALREARIGYRGLGVQGGAVVVTLTDPSQAEAARQQIQELNPLLQGGTFGAAAGRELLVEEEPNGRFRLSLSESAAAQRVDAAVTQSLEVVRRRIDELGTREPTIQRQGQDRILVQVPGERDPSNIKRLLGQTARLTFHMVDLDASMSPGEPVQPGFERLPSAEGEGSPEGWVVDRRVELSGENLVDAQPTFQDGQAVVSFRFDSAGARKFGRITQDHVGQLFAIVLDGEVISAPRIREPILGGSGIISGSFTPDSANELAVLLRAGALPAPLEIIEERSVGPDLGADSIRAGTIASVLAVVLVVGFMLVYYGLFGAFANLALAVNLLLLLASLSVLGATLTLPGIAGIVLTVGMAVDSNVLIFERIREEVRLGKSPMAGIDNGFDQAMRAVIDSNITTLIAGVVLFEFGTGPIRGFAVTLSIGVLTTMFTAVTVTRLIITTWYRRRRPALIPI
jgi:preprotein translocase subunit SecD